MKFTINGDKPKDHPLTPKQQQLVDFLTGLPDGKLVTLKPLVASSGVSTATIQDMFPETIAVFRTGKKGGRGNVWGNPATVKAYKEQG